MQNIFVETWSEFKSIRTVKNCGVQYTMRTVGDTSYYRVFIVDGGIIWSHEIEKVTPTPEGSDQEDFETYYKATANQAITPRNSEGKELTIAVSRPQMWQTSFTMRCDDIVTPAVGEGKSMFWDFSNSTDNISAPTGYKRKRIEWRFIDPIYIKEGTLYFYNAQKGSYFDMFIVAKAGSYYLDNTGTPTLATEDTPFARYINHHFFSGDCPMGDELNTETATEDAFPTDYAIWVEITVPLLDLTSYGYAELELYRQRTMIL